ncbi:GNAT family N-acetyltransferase [Kitasatospora sp. NPDC093806]|uniref:GNAT family N-acetyltransferase n=1 Tax=Kitasatospora sp. NPDC093806 TaxID=3155075 RepID=UPI003434FB50
MVIRPARPSEAAELGALALRSKAHWGYDAEFIEACRVELTLDPDVLAAGRATVVEADGRVLGFITLTGAPPEGELDMLFVEPEAIGRGIGRQLMEHLRAQAPALGFRRLTIAADPHAEPFYLAMGAVRIGTIPSGSIPGRELPLMALDFAPAEAPHPAATTKA